MHSITRPIAAALGAAALTGIALLVPAANASPALADDTLSGCEVTGGTLSWGVKESFRSYISGSIANGSWEVSDGASYETPNFSWTDPVGVIDPATGEGSVSFTGTISFTGHEGVLDLVFANPTIEFRGDGTANLLLDARSNNAQGELVVDETQISVGRIDGIGDLDPASGSATIADAPAILTADGAQAFAGFYATGDSLDPVNLSLEFAPCEGDASEEAEEVPAEEDEVVATPISTETTEPEVPWVPIIIGAAAVLVIAVTAILLVTGRKNASGAGGTAPDDPIA